MNEEINENQQLTEWDNKKITIAFDSCQAAIRDLADENKAMRDVIRKYRELQRADHDTLEQHKCYFQSEAMGDYHFML